MGHREPGAGGVAASSRRQGLCGAMLVVSSVVVGFALATAGGAWAYHTRFVATTCNANAPQFTDYFTRQGSITVALHARSEGYQWGGGCWNDNDLDDSPRDPTSDPNTGGEGPDCSGLVFKVWRESLTESDAGAYQWNMLPE